MIPKPLILAIETSGRTGSVALALGPELLAETCFSTPMKHSAEVFPAVQQLLQRFSKRPADIEHVYISVGPGSFTGLRIAVALAKSMNLANDAKIIAVDTLDIIAANANDCIEQEKVEDLTKIATILDAKRSRFFIASYQNENGLWKKTMADCLMTAGQFLENFAGNSQPLWLLGEGLVYYKDKFKADGIRFLDERYWYPRAENVYKLGWQMALADRFADPLTLKPAYLQRPDVKERI